MIHRWLHRKGIARVLNTRYPACQGGFCYSLIEARGPRKLAATLACWAVRHGTEVDWLTIRPVEVRQPGRWRYLFNVRFSKLP